jgi:hypothetical protein
MHYSVSIQNGAAVIYKKKVVMAQLTMQSNRRLMLYLRWSIRLGQRTKRAQKLRTRTCLFLQLLSLDIRFQIYKQLVPEPQAIQVVDIFEPEDDNSKALTALLSTNHQIRHEIQLWYSQNNSWLTRREPRGNAIQLFSTVKNTIYHLKWTTDFGCSFIPSKEVEAWHQFCFHNFTQSPIGPLVIEFQLSSRREALVAFERLFTEPYRIEMGRRKTAVGPLPMAAFLTSIEIIFPLVETNVTQAGMLPGWKWDEMLGLAWNILWHNARGCFTVTKCDDMFECIFSGGLRRPKFSWSMHRI